MMRMLAGHPCAVQLQAVYEDATTYYLVRSSSHSYLLSRAS